jgi:hypothetical protein
VLGRAEGVVVEVEKCVRRVGEGVQREQDSAHLEGCAGAAAPTDPNHVPM